MQHVQRNQQIQHRQPLPGGRRFKSCPRYHHRPGPVRGRVFCFTPMFHGVNVLTYTTLGAIVLAVRHQELHLRVREEYR